MSLPTWMDQTFAAVLGAFVTALGFLWARGGDISGWFTRRRRARRLARRRVKAEAEKRAKDQAEALHTVNDLRRTIDLKNEELAESDRVIADLNAMLERKDRTIEAQDQRMERKDARIAHLEVLLDGSRR